MGAELLPGAFASIPVPPLVTHVVTRGDIWRSRGDTFVTKMSPKRPWGRKNRASHARFRPKKPLQISGEGGMRTPGTAGASRTHTSNGLLLSQTGA